MAEGRMQPMNPSDFGAHISTAGPFLVDLVDELDGEVRDSIEFVAKLLSGLVHQFNDNELWLSACDCCGGLAVFCLRCGSAGTYTNRAERRARHRKRAP